MNGYEIALAIVSSFSIILICWMVKYFNNKIEKLEETVTNLNAYVNISLAPQIKRIRQKEERKKEHGMTAEEKQKFKEYIKDYTEAQIIGWTSAMSFILLLEETTKKLRDELFDMLNICIEVIKEGHDKRMAEVESQESEGEE